MKIEIKQMAYIVIERWDTGGYDMSVTVFDTREKAKDYIDNQSRKMIKDIDCAEVINQDCIITVENEHNWWEATLEEKEIL